MRKRFQAGFRRAGPLPGDPDAERCAFAGKLQYRTEAEARQAAERSLDRDSSLEKLGFYLCPACMCFHLTSKPGKAAGDRTVSRKD